VHFRRALLLFAIVLGLAALAASVSRTPSDNGTTTAPTRFPPPPQETETTPTLEAGPPVPAAKTINFDSAHPKTHKVDAGTPTTVVVKVESPGQVLIPTLGVSDSAEPLTPASFDLLPTQPGPAAILFNPAGSSQTEDAGTLLVEPAS
jgi:hypothetical protein